jgi:uncharacterized protein Yka (UPF0111/DUF47 family)
MFRMSQKELAFFDGFETASEIAYQAAVILQDLVLHYENPEERIKLLEAKEHEGDQQVHAMMDLLNKSFITPMDREDLLVISKEIDNVIDEVESGAHLFTMLNVQNMRDEAKTFVRLIVQGNEAV